jgi:hypothetical protein
VGSAQCKYVVHRTVRLESTYGMERGEKEKKEGKGIERVEDWEERDQWEVGGEKGRKIEGSISQKKQTRREGTEEESKRLFYDRRDVNIMKYTVSHTSKKRKMGETGNEKNRK